MSTCGVIYNLNISRNVMLSCIIESGVYLDSSIDIISLIMKL